MVVFVEPISENVTTDEALCQLAQGGDAAAEEALLLRYRRAVLACSRSYFLMGGDNEDLIQEGMIGLLKAIRRYDAGRGASFHTFANRCINHALISAVTAAVRGKHLPLNTSISLESPLVDSLDPLSFAAQPLPDPEELIITEEELHERLRAIRSRLSKMEQRIIRYYLKGLSYSEIAQAMGCSVKSADNAVQRVRRKLSQHK